MWGPPGDAGLGGRAAVTASLVLPTGVPREAQRGAAASLGSAGCWETIFPGVGSASSPSCSVLVPSLGTPSEPGPRRDSISLWGDVSKSRVPRGSNYARLAAPGAHSWRPTPVRDPLGEASRSSVHIPGGREPVLSGQLLLCSPNPPPAPPPVCPSESVLGSGWWAAQGSFPRQTPSSTASPAAPPGLASPQLSANPFPPLGLGFFTCEHRESYSEVHTPRHACEGKLSEPEHEE